MEYMLDLSPQTIVTILRLLTLTISRYQDIQSRRLALEVLEVLSRFDVFDKAAITILNEISAGATQESASYVLVSINRVIIAINDNDVNRAFRVAATSRFVLLTWTNKLCTLWLSRIEETASDTSNALWSSLVEYQASLLNALLADQLARRRVQKAAIASVRRTIRQVIHDILAVRAYQFIILMVFY
jgi:hypothetical protein